MGLFCHTHDRENSGFCVQQGTYVEGIKEEVVLSPAHALSLIAAGEGTSTLLQNPAFAGGDNGLQVLSIGIGDKTFVLEHMQIFHAY